MRTARELVEGLLTASLTDDPAMIDLYAPDAVHELAFTPSGAPMTMTYAQMATALAAANGATRVTGQTLTALRTHEGGDTAIAEYEISGTLASTGEPLVITGAMVVTAAGGQIARSRNYMDPLVLARIMA